MYDIPILHHILPSLLPILSSSLDRRHTLRTVTQVVKIVVSNDLSFDETTLEVGVDCSCCLRGKTAFGNRPAADLLLAG